MKDEKKLDLVLERFYNRFNKYNTKVLEELGNVIKQFDGLSPSQAHKLAQELKYSNNVNELLKELSKISGKSIQDINTLLDKVAEENVAFAEAYGEVKSYKDNIRLQRYVDTIKKETNDTFKNLSKTKSIGFTFIENNNVVFKPLKQVYTDLIDEAVFNVSTGVVDYQSAMRSTIRQLADSGIKIHEDKVSYASGYNRRIDSSVRQAVLTGVRKVNLGVQERVGKEFGADGYEISAHFLCADDHLDIQGRQFSKKEYERLNDDLDRPIGELNCKHFAFAIILGVNLPSYTEKQLKEYRNYSQQKIKYNGKTYTRYEASQVQRSMETEIRKQKDRQIIAKASNNNEEILKAQKKITQLTKEYSNFSNKAKLPVYKNRLTVSGYKRTKVDNINYKLLNDKDISKMDKETKDLLNKLSKKEIKSIESYIGIGYDEINKTIRYGKPDEKNVYNSIAEIKKDIDNISNSIRKNSLKQDIITFRGTYEDLSKYKVGETFTMYGFASTSLSERIALHHAKKRGDGGVVLEIKTPKGTNGIYLGDNFGSLNEKELLLDKNMKYELLEIKEMKDNNYGNYKKYILKLVK